MPSRTNVALYEVGTRLTQCMRAFPARVEDDFGLDSSFRLSLLHRLEAALDTFYSANVNDVLQRRCTRIMEELFSFDIQSNQTSFEPVHTLLTTLHSWLSRWLDSREAQESDCLWFRLGLAITDGVGQPPADRLFFSDDGRLSSERSCDASWDWNDGSLVNEILVELSAYQDFPGVELLRPNYDQCLDISEMLPGVPEHLWGWGAVTVVQKATSGITVSSRNGC